ncbi:MAG: YkgJ family cysteine cluster protein [Candidatus Eremiobacteraeota bacterium]|nr:YkgJ family cysteine cluster protein [Candidatus Eremiobacteraeota bacterium]
METYGESPCQGCDTNCCSNFYIILEDVKDRDWVQWLSYHRGVTVKKLKGRSLQVWFDSPCTHLKEDGSCAIYRKRPRMCRDFTCEKLPAPEGKKR